MADQERSKTPGMFIVEVGEASVVLKTVQNCPDMNSKKLRVAYFF